MYKTAAVLSACHDRGHINFMLVLQSCTDPLYILPGSSSEKYATPSDGAEDIQFSGIKSEPDEVSTVCMYVY